MRIEDPVRWCGLAALLAGLLLVISQLLGLYLRDLYPVIYGRAFIMHVWAGIDGYLGILLGALVQLGLIGLYIPQARAAGALGVIGFFIAFTGTRLAMGASFISPFIGGPDVAILLTAIRGEEQEEFWGPVAIFALSFVLGWVVFALATFRARTYPRGVATLLMAGALILLLPLPLNGLIFAVAIAWTGYTLFVTQRGNNRQTGTKPTG